MVDDKREFTKRTADFAWAATDEARPRADLQVRNEKLRDGVPRKTPAEYERDQAAYKPTYEAEREAEKTLADETGDKDVDRNYGKTHRLVKSDEKPRGWDTKDRQWNRGSERGDDGNSR